MGTRLPRRTRKPIVRCTSSGASARITRRSGSRWPWAGDSNERGPWLSCIRKAISLPVRQNFLLDTTGPQETKRAALRRLFRGNISGRQAVVDNLGAACCLALIGAEERDQGQHFLLGEEDLSALGM